VYVGNQTSFSSGFTRGPNFSYQWKMPVSYGFYTIYMCTMISGVKKLVYRYNSMQAEKVAIPSGGYAGVYGKDVSSYDGYYGYRDAPYKFRIGSDFVIDQNVTKTTSGGASAWGFSITSTTTKSVTRTQRATAGLATTSHWLFGYEQPGGAMKVFYSY
jgi:hypothetical protein